VLLDGSLADTPRLLRDVGRLIGAERAAEPLAREAAAILERVRTRVAGIPAGRRVRVYFARGANGLTTAPAASLMAETLDLAGGINVVPPAAGAGAGFVNVSLEDVLKAAPDVIVASDAALAAGLRERPGWRDLAAVGNGKVLVPPALPFGWFDAPPSVNRLLGVQWLARSLYPDLFPEPLAPRVKAFHTRFYHREPTDQQIRALLEGAGAQ
jgi:iron complex transport system substrate-binding protein